MHYKTPGKMEKHRIVDELRVLLLNECIGWNKSTDEEKTKKWRRVKVVYNPFSGKFKTIGWKAKPKKNEIVVIDQFPGEWFPDFAKPRNESATSAWIRIAKKAKMSLYLGFYEATLKQASNAYRNTVMLAAERCLEITNKRRCEE
ncbi:MAG: hypothetical protein J6K25_15925 [Thermoguttaceae bacterium]|nr:hypothetical protein [Thermoguttaceae bacterium]MBP3532644.1 hypothetical protein [Thermoguttaceae bacterium]